MNIIPKNPITRKDKVVDVRQVKQEKEIKLIASQRRIKGLTLYEYDRKTQELRLAKFEPLDAKLKENAKGELEAEKSNHKLVVTEGCYYLQALNPKNAWRKLVRDKIIQAAPEKLKE